MTESPLPFRIAEDREPHHGPLGNICTVTRRNPQETAKNQPEDEISFVYRAMPQKRAFAPLVRRSGMKITILALLILWQARPAARLSTG
jgi:hypothetical protein